LIRISNASQFNSSTHGLPYEGEGENIAWASGGLAYVLDEPVDITEVGAAGNIKWKVWCRRYVGK